MGQVNPYIYVAVALLCTFIFLKTNYAFLTVVDYRVGGGENQEPERTHPMFDELQNWVPTEQRVPDTGHVPNARMNA